MDEYFNGTDGTVDYGSIGHVDDESDEEEKSIYMQLLANFFRKYQMYFYRIAGLSVYVSVFTKTPGTSYDALYLSLLLF